MGIHELDNTTIKSINSGQVITDLEAIVKELIENSLDANATSIDVVCNNSGLDSILVKDNGDGIPKKDRQYIARRHHTSKLASFEDLAKVQTYGFRGEAINSVLNIADRLTLATKTTTDVVGEQYDIDRASDLTNISQTNAISTASGSIITIYSPFYNLPVRRQLASKNASSNMKRIQELLMSYALPHPAVRFSFVQASTGCGYAIPPWIKPATNSVESNITLLCNSKLTNLLNRFTETRTSNLLNSEHIVNAIAAVTIDIILPKPGADTNITFKQDNIFVYVNKRPINYVKSGLIEVISSVKTRFRQNSGFLNSRKSPFIYLNIQIPTSAYDVNVEPNKSVVLFHDKNIIYQIIEQILDKAYAVDPAPSSLNSIGATVASVAESASSSKKALVGEETISVSACSAKGQQPFNTTQKHQQARERDEGEHSDTPASLETFEGGDDEPDSSWSFSMQSDDEKGYTDELESSNYNTSESPLHFACTPSSRQTSSSPNWQIKEEAATVGTGEKHSVEENSCGKPTNSFPSRDNSLGCSDSNNYRPQKSSPLASSGSFIHDFFSPVRESAAATPLPCRSPSSRSPVAPMTLLSSLPQKRRDASSISPTAKRATSFRFDKTSVSPSSSSLNSTKRQSKQKDILSMLISVKATAQQQQPQSFERPRQFQPQHTLGHQLTISITLEDIKTASDRRRSVDTVIRRLPVEEYLKTHVKTEHGEEIAKDNARSSENNEHSVSAIDIEMKAPFTEILSATDCNASVIHLKADGLSFYTKGFSSSGTKYQQHIINTIGLVSLESMSVFRTWKKLVEEQDLVPKKSMNRPIQIVMRGNECFDASSALCPVLTSLECKQTPVKNDEHGQTDIIYNEVTNEDIVRNGFRVRWRKAEQAGSVIVQFTRIYDGLDIADFRELLAIIGKSTKNTQRLLLRPMKVRRLLWSLAKQEIHQHPERNSNDKISILDDISNDLEWRQDTVNVGGQQGEVLRWDIGYISSPIDQAIVCKLSTP